MLGVHTNTVLRALRMLMLVAAPMSLGLVAVFSPLESLIWHGRWAESVVPVQVISVCYPLNVALGVPMSLQLANPFSKPLLTVVVFGRFSCSAVLASCRSSTPQLWARSRLEHLPWAVLFS